MGEVYYIPKNAPFLLTLANYLKENFLTNSRYHILLPNRRSVRELKKILVEQSGTLFLPKIEAIGDVDEEEISFIDPKILNDIQPAITQTEKKLAIAKLTYEWKQNNNRPISYDQAVWLGIEFIKLLNDIEREQVSIDRFSEIIPYDLAAHAQISLDFLQFILKEWPSYLKSKGLLDSIDRRNKLLKIQAEIWQKNPPDYHIIAAGSMGSQPATANLLQIITKLPNGILILPGITDEKDLPPHNANYCISQLINIIKPEKITPIAPTANNSPIIKLIEADSLHEEAGIIALIMRGNVQNKLSTALVTQNRALARLVCSELKRWKIDIDDSAGIPFINTPFFVFFRLISELVALDFSPISLLSVLKHPLSIFNADSYVTQLEILHIRKRNFACLFELRIDKEDKIYEWLEKLKSILLPLKSACSNESIRMEELLKLHIEVFESLASDEINKLVELEECYTLLQEIIKSVDINQKISPKNYPGIIDALLDGHIYRKPYGQYPGLMILSPMEARLLYFECVIIGDINENSWPGEISSPWINNSMSKELGIISEEKRIGLLAHDFECLTSMPNIYLTRALKIDGRSTLASPWLIKLKNKIVLKNESIIWQRWYRELSKPNQLTLLKPPSPIPPLKVRPKEYSATSIERLIRNPYEFYAIYILKLKNISELSEKATSSIFGDFIHKIVEEYTNEYSIATSSLRHFLYIADRTFKKYMLPKSIKNLWWPRVEVIAEYFIKMDEARRKNIKKIGTEIKNKRKIGEYMISAKADRIEYDNDETITIIDFKTGQIPKESEVNTGFRPQLPIEAVLLKTNSAIKLAYWRLTHYQETDKIDNLDFDYKNTEEIENNILRLIEYFALCATPYLSEPWNHLDYHETLYQHLARVKEWRYNPL